MGQEVLVEPFVNAMEVSVTVLETAHGPVALLPTEIELWEMDEVLTKSDLDLQHHVDRNEVSSCSCSATKEAWLQISGTWQTMEQLGNLCMRCHVAVVDDCSIADVGIQP